MEQSKSLGAIGSSGPHPFHPIGLGELKAIGQGTAGGDVFMIFQDLSPEGKLLHFVPIPKDEVTNCAFAGLDWRTLFITAGGTLWSIPTKAQGFVAFAQR